MRQRNICSLVIVLTPGEFWLRRWNGLASEEEIQVLRAGVDRVILSAQNEQLVIDLSRIGRIGPRGINYLCLVKNLLLERGRVLKICGLRTKFGINEVAGTYPLTVEFPHIYSNAESAIVSFAQKRPRTSRAS